MFAYGMNRFSHDVDHISRRPSYKSIVINVILLVLPLSLVLTETKCKDAEEEAIKGYSYYESFFFFCLFVFLFFCS